MANDSNEKDAQSSRLRDKILRDLEEINKQSEQSTVTPLILPDISSYGEELYGGNRLDPLEEGEDYLATDLPPISSSASNDIKVPLFGQEEPVTSEVFEPFAEQEDLTETLAIHKHSVTQAIQENQAKSEKDSLDDTIISPAPTAHKPEMPSRQTQARKRTRQRKKQDSIAKRIVKTIAVVVVLLLIATGVTGYFYVKSSLGPVDVKATENIQVEIPEGSSTRAIAQILEENHLIKNATVFNYYAKLKSYNNFRSGYYNLNQSMSVDELAKALQEDGTATAQDPIDGKILVVEGYTINQIAQAVTKNVYQQSKTEQTPFTAEEFLATVKNEDFINRMVAAYPRLFASLPAADSGVIYRLEGYLFPATYDYTKETTMEGLVEQMIAAMDATLQPYYDQLEGKGLDVNQLLTLASLVEKEGATDEDRRTIAGVFYNRLNAGMPLQSNIAILYAMGKLGEKTSLAEDAAIDTAIDSPYNIYVNTGLMPGPVDSPSQAAIDATINQNKTDNYYFVADVTTGTVYFAQTAEEHNENVEKYVNSKLNN